MRLAPGTRLGSYEVTAALGAGGMGEVYRATDARLGRQVALKILPDAWASDPERLARLDREARTLAALNHPNVAAIYGLEESGPVTALVLELVEGPTLAEVLAPAPSDGPNAARRGDGPAETPEAERVHGAPRQSILDVTNALSIALQIASALEAAHDQGIIHRDLKPANVKVRDDGTVKVLDFGLAKLIDEPDSAFDSGAALSQSPTVMSPAITRLGVILGTAAYMSPEQARGKPADRRSDIWAFGCVLFEMLTGRRPFTGEDLTETLANVIKHELDWNQLPAGTPRAVRTLLRRCLQKNPRQRWQSADDIRIELEDAMHAPPETLVAAASRTPVGRRGLPLLAAGLVAAVGLGAAAGWSLKPAAVPTSSTSRLLMNIAPVQLARQGQSPGVPLRTAVALSPDGRSLVFVGFREGIRQLYLRRLSTLVAVPLFGTEDADSPFFSPDGRWIGFWQGSYTAGASGMLKKVPIEGGPAVQLCETARPVGASWGSHGRVVYATLTGGLWHVPDTGGVPEPLTIVDAATEVSHRLPQVLPGGRAVMFTILKSARDWDRAQIVVQSLADGRRTVVVEGGVDAKYVPTGHLVYADTGTLMAVPFDLDRLEATGGSVGLFDGVMQDVYSASASGRSGAAQFAVSAEGTLAYVAGGMSTAGETAHVWVDRGGRAERLDMNPAAVWLRPSPDGRQLLVETLDDVSIHDVARGVSSRVTTEGVVAIWHPDSQRLTYASRSIGPSNLFLMPADRSAPAERLTTSGNDQYPGAWTPDGRTLVFTEAPDATNRDIWALSVGDGAPVVRPLLTSAAAEFWPDISPDGRFLAYVSDQSGREEVYVQPFPGPGRSVQISNNRGTQPAWSPNGRELFYTEPGQDRVVRMMSVAVTLGDAFTAGRPTRLFEGMYRQTVPLRGYDPSSDGRRFLMSMSGDEGTATPATEIVVVQHWFDELRRVAR